MVDKSNLLHQMRKHAQTFSSAVSSPLVVDEANINRAVVLIDVAARDSGLGVLRKMSFKIPPLLRSLRKRIPEAISSEGPLTEEQQKKEYEKFKRAEQKLRKLLDTKDC